MTDCPPQELRGPWTHVALAIALGTGLLAGQESRPAAGPGESRPADVWFNSNLRLGVVIEDVDWLGPPFLYWSPQPSPSSFTPRVIPIRIPAGTAWHVRPCASPVWKTGGEPITCSDYTDADLATLVDEVIAKRIPGVSLVGCSGVTDRGIASVARARGLTYLDLGGFPKERGPDLTDAGLRSIEGLAELRTLRISGLWRDPMGGWRTSGPVTGTHGITDAALRSVARLTRLRRLDLSGSFLISGEGVAELAPLQSLESLALPKAGTSRLGPGLLERVPTFPCLRYLDASGTEIASEDVARIAKLPSLEVLCVQSCRRITDEDLLALANRPSLRRIVVGDLALGPGPMRVTHQGLTALAELMPWCKIEWTPTKAGR